VIHLRAVHSTFFSSEERGIGLWECGNLAFCARFPSSCGNRFVIHRSAISTAACDCSSSPPQTSTSGIADPGRRSDHRS
jgi:hypothetical protein